MHKITGFPDGIAERMSITLENRKQKPREIRLFRGLLVVGDRGLLGGQPIKDGADMLTRSVTTRQYNTVGIFVTWLSRELAKGTLQQE